MVTGEHWVLLRILGTWARRSVALAPFEGCRVSRSHQSPISPSHTVTRRMFVTVSLSCVSSQLLRGRRSGKQGHTKI